MPDAASGGTTPSSKAGDLPAVARLMEGKRGLIMGVANERSIAWGISQALHAAGADLPAGDLPAGVAAAPLPEASGAAERVLSLDIDPSQ